MKEEIRVNLYLDNRRIKANGRYPLKLRLYCARVGKEKLYRTGHDLTEEGFNQGYLNQKAKSQKAKLLKNEKNEIIKRLSFITVKAEKIIEGLNIFNFEDFEARFYNKASKLDVCDYYEDYINRLTNEGRIRTAESYSLSMNRLKDYLNSNRKKPLETIPFDIITKETLQGFEKHYLEKGLSITSIGFYLRPLRAIYNLALSDVNSKVKIESYPFGKHKYKIPTGQNIKKALSSDQLKKLFNSIPETPQQQKAKAFWFFSYLANGMNFKDIAELKYSSLNENVIEFYRAKTKNTTKENLKPIEVILPQYAIDIINLYGQKEKLNSNYIFPILDSADTPKKAIDKIKSFKRYVNKHFKKVVLKEGITENVTTYWARHSFATHAMKKGARIELLQESLGHKNIKTTQNYLAGFDKEVKEKLSKSLLDF